MLYLKITLPIHHCTMPVCTPVNLPPCTSTYIVVTRTDHDLPIHIALREYNAGTLDWHWALLVFPENRPGTTADAILSSYPGHGTKPRMLSIQTPRNTPPTKIVPHLHVVAEGAGSAVEREILEVLAATTFPVPFPQKGYSNCVDWVHDGIKGLERHGLLSPENAEKFTKYYNEHKDAIRRATEPDAIARHRSYFESVSM